MAEHKAVEEAKFKRTDSENAKSQSEHLAAVNSATKLPAVCLTAGKRFSSSSFPSFLSLFDSPNFLLESRLGQMANSAIA